jgi:ADP-heptose:LPS heptosyltransferase
MEKRILISRTDSIGDVMLTLPMAYYIKQLFPDARVFFLGKSYTQAIIERCQWVDQFVNADRATAMPEQMRLLQDLKLDIVIFALPDARWMRAAYMAKIPQRIATGHRVSSWRWATRRPLFGRKNSNLHEAQLNLKLLLPLGLKNIPSLSELNEISLLKWNSSNRKKRLIVHPFSQGSALNWTLHQYDELVGNLMEMGWEIVISGTEKDQLILSEFGGEYLSKVQSVCGQFSLPAFMDYISESSILLACSTGPLHIAASAGIHAVGLYVDRRPIHPGRWSPLGPNVHILEEVDAGQNQIMMSPISVATFLMSIAEHPTTKR